MHGASQAQHALGSTQAPAQWRGSCAAVCVALASMLAPPSAGSADASDVPSYVAQPCCNLCPRAADPNAYVTSSLKKSRFLIEGQDGWLFVSELDLATDFTPKDPLVYADLARLHQAFKARGTEVVVFARPPRGLVETSRLKPDDRARYNYDAALKAYTEQLQRLREAGFIVPDYSAFANEREGDAFYLRRDVHWKASGARRTAQLIAATIKSLKLDAGLPRKAFETHLIGPGGADGVFSRLATVLCGGQYPKEIVPRYKTVAPESSDLFGDAPQPEVALVGTSFSRTEGYNFAGFLQEFLQTDLLNVAIAGGAFDGALTEYLISDAFQKHPPKILIWEFTPEHIIDSTHIVMRRLLPLVANGCAEHPALLTNTVSINPGDDLADVLVNGGAGLIMAKSRDLVVDLQFEDPNVKDIKAEIWYLDGGHETLREGYNEFTNARGRFVLELNQDPVIGDAPIIDFRVQIVTPLAKPTGLTAALCRGAS